MFVLIYHIFGQENKIVRLKYFKASYRARPSPGALTPTSLRSKQLPSPGECDSHSGTRRVHPSLSNGRVITVKPGSPDRETPTKDNSDSTRSLHKSDLQHGRCTQPSSRENSPQRSSTNSVPTRGSESSPNRSPTRAIDQSPTRGSNHSPSRGSDGSDRRQPIYRPTIHVPIPSIEPDDSSATSGGVPGSDPGDTSIDVSSISGGDF